MGTGSFGRVVLAKLKKDKNKIPYALKILKKTEIIRLKQVDHVKTECKILKMLDHPYIIKLKGKFKDSKYVYLLLEYICGGELFRLLRSEWRFINDVALFYITEIACALEYIHSLDIAYRDLKPENLLIDRDGHLKITDFGFAKIVRDKTYTLWGTPEYLAPEIIQSNGHDKNVDWWALGILIFEFLAGYPPFYDENPWEIYKKIIEGYFEFPSNIDSKAKDLIKNLLKLDPNERLGNGKHGSANVKKHKWFRGVDWELVQNREIPPPWVPSMAGEDDTQYYDEYPDSTDPVEEPSTEEQGLFDDF